MLTQSQVGQIATESSCKAKQNIITHLAKMGHVGVFLVQGIELIGSPMGAAIVVPDVNVGSLFTLQSYTHNNSIL